MNPLIARHRPENRYAGVSSGWGSWPPCDALVPQRSGRSRILLGENPSRSSTPFLSRHRLSPQLAHRIPQCQSDDRSSIPRRKRAIPARAWEARGQKRPMRQKRQACWYGMRRMETHRATGPCFSRWSSTKRTSLAGVWRRSAPRVIASTSSSLGIPSSPHRLKARGAKRVRAGPLGAACHHLRSGGHRSAHADWQQSLRYRRTGAIPMPPGSSCAWLEPSLRAMGTERRP